MKKGFTLVEILVTISILGILMAIALISFTGSQKQARDVKAKADVRQYQTALEQYANTHNNYYPYFSSQTPLSEICTELGMTDCPEVVGYYLASGGSGEGTTNATGYVMVTDLQASENNYFVNSDGDSGETNVTEEYPEINISTTPTPGHTWAPIGTPVVVSPTPAPEHTRAPIGTPVVVSPTPTPEITRVPVPTRAP